MTRAPCNASEVLQPLLALARLHWPRRPPCGMVQHKLTPFLNLDVQLFYNRRSELVVESNRILAVNNGVVQLENYANDGRGQSYGAEILLRHELTKNFFGWIAYTIVARDLEPGRLPPPDVTLSIAGLGPCTDNPDRSLQRLPRGAFWNTGWAALSGDWSIGGRFRLVSGNPTTPYTTATHDLDTNAFVPKSGGINSARLPTFHQLDIRVDYKMAFDSFLVNLYVDLINAYNRKNAEALLWDFRYRESAPLALLPFLPVVGLAAEF